MANNQFKLPPVSPLMGSTLRAFRKTIGGNPVDPQCKAKKSITEAIIYLISPFRWYEKMFVLPRARKKNPEEIVFIVGHWRGGTTFLHNLMCQTENASYVTTYQTVFPNFMGSKWLFGPIMKAIMPDKRPSDNVKLAVDFPQEEEFALGGVNPHAYYRYMFFPKHYKKYYAQATRFEGLSEEEKQTFRRDYKDLIHKALLNKPGKLLVVKNPVNTARIKFLHKEYPKAKWIHIYRNPYTVFRSTLKFFTQLLPTLWFEGVSNDFIQQMILETYVKLYQDYDSALAEIPGLNMVELKFEDFEKDPVGNLRSIYNKLGLKDFDKSHAQFDNYVNSQKSYQKNKYEMPREMVELVDKYWGEYVERWGYGVPEE
ncbi:MAG: sulfotransferase [Bacteroidetes bacterium]|nr:MAG: sulfotransferase [Bacteroidota bacterium]